MTRRSMHMVNSFDPSSGVDLGSADQALLERRHEVLGSMYRLFYSRPVHVARAAGVLLYDEEGTEYLDAYNNVPVVGHSNPRVHQAVSQQLQIVNSHTRYLSDDIVEYAERLTSLFPDHLTQAVFTCTGSEAVDLGVRIARHVTGRDGVIVTRHAYHGTTTTTAQLSPALGPNNPVPPEVVLIDAPDAVRGPEDPLAAFARSIDDAVDELRRRGFDLAVLVLDSIFASDGLQTGPTGLLRVAGERAHAHGGLYLADEVQAGFGRTGAAWWGFQRHEAVPDLVAMGKPMGNGLPIAGLVGRAEIFDRFGTDVRYFNTFGGSAVCVAAAQAVLSELVERELVQSSHVLGASLLESLRDLTAGDPGVEDVRGAGLFLTVELVEPGTTTPDAARADRVVNAMREQRVLISASGTYDNTLKIRPPLVFGAEHAPRLLEAFEQSLTT